MQPTVEPDNATLPQPNVAAATRPTPPDSDLARLLGELVAFPTVSDDKAANHAALDYVARYLQDRGMHVQRFNPTGSMHEALVASTRIDNAKSPVVLLAAHIDVIGADPAMFAMHHEDGRYTGRGVFDMKFAIAAYLKAVDEISQRIHDYDFAILITSDEELGGRDGINGVREFVQAGYLPRVLVLPDGGDNWQLETASNGYMHLTLEAHGKAGHSSRPWLGDNAAVKLIDALHEIKARFKDQNPDTDTFNFASLQTGDGPANQIPDYASAELSIRLRHAGSLERWQQVISNICRRHQVTVTERAAWDAIYNDLQNPYVLQFADITEAVTGLRIIGFHSYAGSDARFYAEAGIPYANAYPTGGGHHSDHEWLAEASLDQFKDVVLRYIEKVAKTADPDSPGKETMHRITHAAINNTAESAAGRSGLRAAPSASNHHLTP